MDRISKEARSRNMSLIKSKNTVLEKEFFKELKKSGVSFKKHVKRLTGTPDAVIEKNKLVIFVDSDFWHGWRLKKWIKRLPNEYWINKIRSNVKRDICNRKKLRKDGWTVVGIWEHQFTKNHKKTINKILSLCKRKK